MQTTQQTASRARRVFDKLTSQPVLLVAIATFAVVLILNPMKLGLMLYGIAKLTAFAFAGDWVDSRIFKRAQPEHLDGIAQGTAWKRKGLIVAAAIIAGALVP
jgi:hypothetical protein